MPRISRLSFLDRYLLEAMEADLDPSTGPREPLRHRETPEEAYSAHKSQIKVSKGFWQAIEQHPFLSLYDRADLQEVLQVLWSVVDQQRIEHDGKKHSYPLVDLLRFLNPGIPVDSIFPILQADPEAYWPWSGIAVPWLLFSKNPSRGWYFSHCLSKDPSLFSAWISRTMAILGYWILVNAFSGEVVGDAMAGITRDFLEGSENAESTFGNIYHEFIYAETLNKALNTYYLAGFSSFYAEALVNYSFCKSNYLRDIEKFFLALFLKNRFSGSVDLQYRDTDPIELYLHQRKVLLKMADPLLLRKTLPPFPLDGVL